MKKLFVLTIATALLSGMLLAGTITVTSPAPGTVWEKGMSHTISWTISGCTDPSIKINIFRNSIAEENFVEQLLCTGCTSKTWAIPASYVNGNYVIRVKTADNACIGDSGVFSVTGGSTEPPRSGSITVTRPNASDKWVRGNSHNITWTSSGSLDPNVKINVFRNSIDPANFVEQLTAPTAAGSKSWNIPATYEPGNYYIRIKTDDNLVQDDSDRFEVTSFLVMQPMLVLSVAHDFELNDIYYTWALGGRIVARIKSNISPYKGDVTIRFRTLPNGREESVTQSVDLARDEFKVISLMAKSPEEMGCGGIALQASLDPVGGESNVSNNVKFKTVYKHTEQDGMVEKVQMKVGGRFVDAGESVDIPTDSDYVTEIKVTVRNCGGARLEGGSLDIKHNLQTTLTEPRGNCRSFNEVIANRNGISLSPGISRTYTIPVTLRFQGNYCRKNVNEITVWFDCGENSAMNRNNVFTFSIR